MVVSAFDRSLSAGESEFLTRHTYRQSSGKYNLIVNARNMKRIFGASAASPLACPRSRLLRSGVNEEARADSYLQGLGRSERCWVHESWQLIRRPPEAGEARSAAKTRCRPHARFAARSATLNEYRNDSRAVRVRCSPRKRSPRCADDGRARWRRCWGVCARAR
jgi:hypothetical protein